MLSNLQANIEAICLLIVLLLFAFNTIIQYFIHIEEIIRKNYAKWYYKQLCREYEHEK